MDLFGDTPARGKAQKPRPLSLPEKSGVEWRRGWRDGVGTDPRLVELRLSLGRARDGADADVLAWVLCVALGWLNLSQLGRVAELVADLLGGVERRNDNEGKFQGRAEGRR